MKYVMTAAAASLLAANTAFAGGMAEPVMEPEPMMEPEIVVEEAGTSGSFVIPLLLVALIAAAASSD